MWMPLEINSSVWKGMKENQECTSGDYWGHIGHNPKDETIQIEKNTIKIARLTLIDALIVP